MIGTKNNKRLTSAPLATNLSLLSKKTEAGIRTPNKTGHNRPLYTVVFLCPPKTQAALCRVLSVMAGCIEQPLKRLAGACTGSSNLIHSVTQRFEPMGGGYSLYTGVRTMSQSNSAQNSEQINTQAAISAIKLPENYPVECKEDFFVLICKTDNLSPTIWRDMLMLMRINFHANIGDIIMDSVDKLNPRIEFCTVAGVYPAVCVAAKAQFLEILPDGSVSKAA